MLYQFVIEGNLASRALLSIPRLPSWTNTDLLTNTVVQMLVDARGYPLSMLLLGQSGFTNADGYALKLSRAMRFEPLKTGTVSDHHTPAPPLSLGNVIFEWQTVPPPPANPPATSQ